MLGWVLGNESWLLCTFFLLFYFFFGGECERGFVFGVGRRWKELQEENKEVIDQMRTEAEQTVDMLRSVVERRLAEEEKIDGPSLPSLSFQPFF